MKPPSFALTILGIGGNREMLKQRAIVFFAFPQSLFHAFAFGDVAAHAEHQFPSADDSAIAADFNVIVGAVLATMACFKMIAYSIHTLNFFQ